MERTVRTRAALLAFGIALFGAAVGARLLQLQVLRADEYRRLARRQHEQLVEVYGRRGAIVDRNGRELAASVSTSSLYAHPGRVPDPARAARLLAPVLEMPEWKLLERLKSDSPFVWLRRRLDPRTVRAVSALDLPVGKGKPFDFETEGKRFYPQGSLAVQVVGYANIDQKGVEGIEKVFDEQLQGGSESYLALRDGHGGAVLQRVRPSAREPEDVALTLDLVLQHIVERELDLAMRESGAKSATAILLDPSTGEVLALANRPTADPNRYSEADPEARRDRAVTDLYEPGSTFKVITAAAALDHGAVTPGQRFDCRQGSIVVAGKRFTDVHSHGILSVREILEKSSNVGIIRVARTFPHEVFRDYIERFGFGRRTGIELPGERAGQLTPVRQMSALSPLSMAMGYEIGVTTLQMVSAIGAVANDGVLVPPRVVLGTRGPGGSFVPAPRPEPRRALSSTTARTLGGLLEGAVLEGTGVKAAVPGYRVAGKTGTARKVIPGQGYSHTQFIASFAGFAPLARPRLAAIVVLDTPRGGYYGGLVAAPVFGRILTAALAYLKVPLDEDPWKPVEPDRKTAEIAARKSEAKRKKSASKDEQKAQPFERVSTTAGQIPDVRGLDLRSAVASLASRGYRARVEGTGQVIAQAPPPGTAAAPGLTCAITLGKLPVASDEAGVRTALVATKGSAARKGSR
jgi:cell division protein FtsI/penicillin-binding protein 2